MAHNRSHIVCDGLVKIYQVAGLEVVALQGLDLEVGRGEMLALVGASGSGKTTLLNILGGLDTPTAGKVWVGGLDLLALGERERTRYKRVQVGFVWQQMARNLIPYLTAQENVELPMLLKGTRGRQRRGRALDLLEMVGLARRRKHRPDRLSGGEQQRVAIAVALANDPPLLLADEPTGQVDSQAAADIFETLRRINRTTGVTIIVVTHDPNIAQAVDRVVGIRDGRTSTEIRRRRDGTGRTLLEEEWVLLDRAGRMQLPKPFVETLDMKDRVKVQLESKHVSVWPEWTQQDPAGGEDGE
jgi:ABC-type lipoprotein export system ATPase subunit